ncbi:MAG: hypothetical protein ACLR5H_13105 [Oscillospiraceae bacterium]
MDQRIESALREGWHRDRECSDYSGKLPPPQEGLADFSEGRKGSSGNAAVFVDFTAFLRNSAYLIKEALWQS